MTPRDVLMEFETNRTAPVAAMRAALSAREEMLPAFVAEFERALHTSLENLPYADSYGIMLEILGEWGDSRAYLPLAAFLRLPGDTLDVLLGDGITETADRVMARVVTSDLNPIFDIILDRRADLFVRSGMITTLLRIAIEVPRQRPDVAAFVESFRSRVEPDVDPYLLAEWTSAVAVLGLNHLEADALASIAAAPSKISCYSAKDFEEDLAQSKADPSGLWFLREHLHPTAIDAIKEVSGWYCYSEKYLSQMEEEEPPPLWDEADIASNPYRDVGRNDPCPCGSSKKFKKCCLN